MPQAPSHRLLVAATVFLAGLAAYQGFAFAAVRTDPALAFPGDAVVVGEVEAAPAALVAAAAPMASVSVSITPRARLFAATPAPTCRVWVGDAEVAAEVAWLAGSAAWPLGAGASIGDVQLVALTLGGRRTLRLVSVRAPDVVDVRLGGDVPLAGTVVDADGHPVPGARVSVAGEDVVAGDDGTFVTTTMAGLGVPVVVRARGFATSALALDLQTHVAGLRVVMRPAGVLQVRLLGSLPGEARARVVVLPAGEPDTSDEAQYPYYLSALEGGVEVDPRGVVRLADLPIGARVRVVVDHPALAATASSVAVVRARPVDLAIPVERAPVIRGRLLASDGRGLAGGWIVAAAEGCDRAARPAAAALPLPPLAFGAGLRVVRADADGRFVTVRPRGSGGRLFAWSPGHLVAEVAVQGADGDAEADLALPSAAPPAPPRLSLLAPEGRYEVRVAEPGRAPRPVVEWGGGTPFRISMRDAVLADVAIRIEDSSGTRTLLRRGVAVLGDIDIDLGR